MKRKPKWVKVTIAGWASDFAPKSIIRIGDFTYRVMRRFHGNPIKGPDAVLYCRPIRKRKRAVR